MLKRNITCPAHQPLQRPRRNETDCAATMISRRRTGATFLDALRTIAFWQAFRRDIGVTLARNPRRTLPGILAVLMATSILGVD